jgi:hypothetical protein
MSPYGKAVAGFSRDGPRCTGQTNHHRDGHHADALWTNEAILSPLPGER